MRWQQNLREAPFVRFGNLKLISKKIFILSKRELCHGSKNSRLFFVSSFSVKMQHFYSFMINMIYTFISVIKQLDAQIFCFTISLFHASTCFEHMCSSSRGQNCITQPLASSHLQVQLLPSNVALSGHVGGKQLYQYYDLYRRLRLQFLVLLMMGAVTPETCRVALQ